MKIHLANNGYLRNFNRFLETFDANDPSVLEVTTNDSWIYVHPGLLALVAALGLKVGPDNIVFDEITAKSGHYLEAMGLFKMIGVASPYPKMTKHESAGRFIPLTQIKTQDEQSKFIRDIIPLLHLSPEEANAIRYTIGELLRNVLEHAQSQNGAVVAAQYSKTTNTIRLGICDTGIGVKGSMQYTWPQRAKTDVGAIEWALAPGVSGTTMNESGNEQNAGAGLFFTRSITLITRDYFLLYSGSGVYRLLKRRLGVNKITLHSDPNREKHSSTDNAPYLQGTLVALDISLDGVKQFSTIFEEIRKVYGAAIRQRKKERYKRPKFI